ncbi:MAG: FtsX-like permease family protein [Acidobacteria bacterium]|nr:MAG: FtsX-like permease family protein [Acidobacteriota bacterium]
MRVGLEVAGKEFGLAWRRLWRRWTVTVLAIATLGLAMGASTAMFSVFYGLVEHPLPLPEARQLVWLQTDSRSTRQINPAGASILDILSYQRRTRALSAVAGFEEDTCTLLGSGAPQHILYTGIEGDFFRALGVAPALGRWLQPSDGAVSFPTVTVISHHVWQMDFGGDPQVLGKKIDVDGLWYSVVGVMPPGFDYPHGSQLWFSEVTIGIPANYRGWRHLSLFGRLKPGVTLAQGRQDLSAVAASLAAKYPKYDGDVGLQVTSLASHVSGPVASELDLMMIGALLVLGLACANVGNLMLGAAVNRWPQIALQVSLGARRRRLFGQLFAEGLTLALLASALGWVIAWGILPLIRYWQGAGLPQGPAIALNGVVVVFAGVITLLMALWFALAPAIELLRLHLGQSLLRDSSPAPRRSPLPAILVVAEVAVTVILLVGAGLFWQSLQRLRHANPGFQPAHVLTFRAAILANNPQQKMARLPYFTRLNQQVRQMPGVAAVGMVSNLPMTTPIAFVNVAEAGTTAASQQPDVLPGAGELAALPGYFQAMGIPLRGRDFVPSDNAKSQPLVAILSASIAHSVFGQQDPIGRPVVLKRAGFGSTARVIGVAGDVPSHLPGDGVAPTVYLPLPRLAVTIMSTAVLARGNPNQLLPAIRRASAQINPQVALFEAATMSQRLSRIMAPVTYRTNLLGLLAILALCLAAAGLYGVLAHGVMQRQHDIGIRMALGADPRRVRHAILAESLRLIGIGAVVGLLISWWLSSSVQPLLAGSRSGGWPWIAVPVLVMIVGLLATLIPAQRAARIDPAITLRHE